MFATRLKQARLAAGLSQELLGIKAGLEEASASTRVNRYEMRRRVPDPELVAKFGEVLNVPTSYFYAENDEEAKLLLVFHRLRSKDRAKALEMVCRLEGDT
jgi:transcriptional regulator with XRE-family HTH domain